MSTPSKYVIIVAGGSGTRMESKTPKQFIELKGKPILMHSILAFFNFDPSLKIILVLPESQISVWESLCVEHSFTINHEVVIGGKERFFSVKHGLDVITTPGVVGIHDGVRPLVSKETISKCYETAMEQGNAIPVVNVHETVRRIEGDLSVTVPRSEYRLVQTPQCFDVELLKSAYDLGFLESFTDDASVAEANGQQMNLVEGNRENIKITTPIDLKIAEALLVNN